MVVAKNTDENKAAFEQLLNETIEKLLNDAHSSDERKEYYLGRSAQKLEDDVVKMMNQCAKGSSFEGYIEKISGQRFPDIIANNFYGVEVKTTKSDSWRSTGNSVLESTRVDDIENIYMLFGKLVDPLDFRYRKYEECLVDVAVTHAPRYLIDMNINEDETIFSKVNISYNEIRQHENPAKPLLTHYREKLGDEASYWWLDIGEDGFDEEPVSPLEITHWRLISNEQKRDLITKAFTYFPEILSTDPLKFTRLAIWLMKRHSIVNPSLRDMFTAGGIKGKRLKFNGSHLKVPKMILTFSSHIKYVHNLIDESSTDELEKYWGIKVNESKKFKVWLNQVVENGNKAVKKYDSSIDIKEIVELYS